MSIRRFRRLLGLTVLTLAPATAAQAQGFADTLATVVYTGPTTGVTAYGSSVGPAAGTVQAPGFVGTLGVQLFCVDAAHAITAGTTYQANLTPLDGSTFADTRLFDRVDDAGYPDATANAVARHYYAKGAWLASQFATTDQKYWGGIQGAIWNFFGGDARGQAFPNRIDLTLNKYDPSWWHDRAIAASTRGFDGLDLGQWAVVTQNGFDGVRGGGVQEFLAHTTGGMTPVPPTPPVSTVPEPGTWALLGTGLLALGAVVRHRRVQG